MGYVALFQRARFLASEIEKLDIKNAGIEGSDAYIDIEGMPRLFSYRSSDRFSSLVYRLLSPRVRKIVPADCCKVAFDVVWRYKYPHLDVFNDGLRGETRRRYLHVNHMETRSDMSLNVDVQNKFSYSTDSVILDVGSHIGMGAISTVLNYDVKQIVCIEADERAYDLLCKNVESAGLQDKIHTRNIAIWSCVGAMSFSSGRYQANFISSDLNEDLKEVTTLDAICNDPMVHDVTNISLTINRAEYDAVLGAKSIASSKSVAICAAGWYRYGGRYVSALLGDICADYGMNTYSTSRRKFLAWHD